MGKVLKQFRRLMMSAVLSSSMMTVYAQQPLESYIETGLQSNLLLQRKNVSLSKAITALKAAKSMYRPSLDFQVAYQTADGGRNIPLPIGDLLNPVYTTLNQLTQSTAFPQIENQTINFLPRNYYDAHIRATMPLINTDIGHNRSISERQMHLSELEVSLFKRELVKEIKVAYFNYLSALQAVVVYQSALDLANEGKRTNEKLLENGKGLPAYVLRSRAEVAGASAKLAEAELNIENARRYFNSLLNRSKDAQVDTAFDQEAALLQATDVLQSGATFSAHREELMALRTGITIREAVLKMDKQFAMPRLNAFFDLGSQSEGFRFNNQSRYYLAGLQLEIPIYNGNRNKYKIQRSRFDLQDAQLELEAAQQQLQVTNSMAYNSLKSAWQYYHSASEQLEAATAYQRLITKGYQAGTNSFIETVDARNQYTAARLALLLYTYQVLSATATLEREQAGYPLTQ